MPVLLLAGCGDGEGWEIVPYHGVPYTLERTAGTGVAYVRANMLPERGPVVQTLKEETRVVIEAKPPMVSTPADAAKAEEIFNKSQRK